MVAAAAIAGRLWTFAAWRRRSEFVKSFTGVGAGDRLPGNDIDTDRIIPARFPRP
jgi:hypothetical protein